MTNPDYRALCAELVALDGHCVVDCTEEWADAMCRIRAALAQLAPVAPTDEEIGEWHDQCADLTRLGEVDHYWAFDLRSDEVAGVVRAALARWGTPAIQPVPVSEWLPGPEDCDAEGGCWWWHPDHKEDDFDDGWILLNPKWADGRRDSDDSLIYTHWLPHWALPVPTPANNTGDENLDG